jgi:hypothetical protein
MPESEPEEVQVCSQFDDVHGQTIGRLIAEGPGFIRSAKAAGGVGDATVT